MKSDTMADLGEPGWATAHLSPSGNEWLLAAS